MTCSSVHIFDYADEPWTSSRQFAILHSALCSLLLVFTRKPPWSIVDQTKRPTEFLFLLPACTFPLHQLSILHTPPSSPPPPSTNPRNDQSVKLILRLAPDESIAQNDPQPFKISIDSHQIKTRRYPCPSSPHCRSPQGSVYYPSRHAVGPAVESTMLPNGPR